MKKSNIEEAIPEVKQVTSDELLKALYWIWDMFDRANVNFFLVYQTAKDVKAQKDLTGDSVHIGVRAVEWTGGSRNLIDSFAGMPQEEIKELATYTHDGVPVYIHIFHKEDACIISLDKLVYKSEWFKLPNSYERFMEVYQ